MIRLTFTVANIDTVIQVYNRIQVQRADAEDGTFTTISGLGPVTLYTGSSNYTLDDATGVSTNWYISRYYSTTTGFYTEWSSPVVGESGYIFYNPLYPEEISYSTSQKLVIDRIRRLIGDPVKLRREYGEEALSSVHLDSETFELPATGWPASVIMGGISFNSLSNPSVNNYKYLRFNEYIGDICNDCVTYSGCDSLIEKTIPGGIDIWYYTFRHSDRQIMEAYNACPPPTPLTVDNANSEVYMTQTAIDLIREELLNDAIEDGAAIRDDVTDYNPAIGLEVRRKLLTDLEKRLKDLIKILMMRSVTGVLID